MDSRLGAHRVEYKKEGDPIRIEKYIVTSSGVKDSKPYSFLTLIVEGVSKASGEPYAFLDEKRSIRADEVIPLGAIVEYTMQKVAPGKGGQG